MRSQSNPVFHVELKVGGKTKMAKSVGLELGLVGQYNV